MRHWTHEFLSIPYKKMNCSQFVEHVLREKFDIDYQFPQSSGNVFEQSNLIKKSVPLFAKKTDVPNEGDLVLMNGTRRLCHVGIYVNIKKRKYVFHTESTMKTAALHEIKDLPLYGYSLNGFYTWLR